MKRASYREAIAWIAEMDSGADDDALDPNVVQDLVTAILVAEIFGVSSEKVGQDIVKYRIKHGEQDQNADRKALADLFRQAKVIDYGAEFPEHDYSDLPAAVWCKENHEDGKACAACGPVLLSHLDHKAVHGT